MGGRQPVLLTAREQKEECHDDENLPAFLCRRSGGCRPADVRRSSARNNADGRAAGGQSRADARDRAIGRAGRPSEKSPPPSVSWPKRAAGLDAGRARCHGPSQPAVAPAGTGRAPGDASTDARSIHTRDSASGFAAGNAARSANSASHCHTAAHPVRQSVGLATQSRFESQRRVSGQMSIVSL